MKFWEEFAGSVTKFKIWDCFSKKPGGRNGRDSGCKDCRRQWQASRRRKMRAKKHMVVDSKNLVIESRVVGDPSGVDMNAVVMIIFWRIQQSRRRL